MPLSNDTTAVPDESESPVHAATPKRQRDITGYETEMRAEAARLRKRVRSSLVLSTWSGSGEAHGVAGNAIGGGDSDTPKLRVGEVKSHEDVEAEDDKSEKETTPQMSPSHESDMSVIQIKPPCPQSYRRGACAACRKKRIATTCNHAKQCNNCEKAEHCFYVPRKAKTAKGTLYRQVLECSPFTSQNVLPAAAFTPVGQPPLINGVYNNGAAYGGPASVPAPTHGYGYYADPHGGITSGFVPTPAYSFVEPCSSYQQPVSSFQQLTPPFQQPSRWSQQLNSSFQPPAPPFQQSISSLQLPAPSLQQPNSSLAFQTPASPFEALPLPYEQNQSTLGTMPVQIDYSGVLNTGYLPYETRGQNGVYHQCEPTDNTTDSTGPGILDPSPILRQRHSISMQGSPQQRNQPVSIQGFQPQQQYIESISTEAFPPHQKHHPTSTQAFPNQQQHPSPQVTTVDDEGCIPLYLEEEDDDDVARPVYGNTAQTSLFQPPTLIAPRPKTGPRTYYPAAAAAAASAGHLDLPRPAQGVAPSTVITPSTSIVASTPMTRSTLELAPTMIIPSALILALQPDSELGPTAAIDDPFDPAIPNHPIPACHPYWTSMEAWAQAQE
ncbi:hypothetical protein AYO20_08869 [Fonsecaea nubica]|uniref:Uncharacterized protein n=1 Tax=Fonsecaea nubica TaxID=856822 RepID=A0A178CM38_9EURO|nr:hypothetical protein AYO20_08869 [Fonsecaea nubica]OAL30153.1 hypothetical protein AYO20_08869 [Fonsecaea nubica]